MTKFFLIIFISFAAGVSYSQTKSISVSQQEQILEYLKPHLKSFNPEKLSTENIELDTLDLVSSPVKFWLFGDFDKEHSYLRFFATIDTSNIGLCYTDCIVEFNEMTLIENIYITKESLFTLCAIAYVESGVNKFDPKDVIRKTSEDIGWHYSSTYWAGAEILDSTLNEQSPVRYELTYGYPTKMITGDDFYYRIEQIHERPKKSDLLLSFKSADILFGETKIKELRGFTKQLRREVVYHLEKEKIISNSLIETTSESLIDRW